VLAAAIIYFLQTGLRQTRDRTDPMQPGLNQILAVSFCLRMIFSENRFPLFRIMRTRPAEWVVRRNCPLMGDRMQVRNTVVQ
jgi:hypothetical protein